MLQNIRETACLDSYPHLILNNIKQHSIYRDYLDVRYEHAKVAKVFKKNKPTQCNLDLFRCSSGSLALPFTVCRWQRRTLIWVLAIITQLITERSWFNRIQNAGNYNKMTKFLQSKQVRSEKDKPHKDFHPHLKLPSFSVIGKSQSTAEDSNLPSITILPTLVWLHKLSLTNINQELNPRGYRINQQTLARPLHFSDNEDRFIIISHSTQYKTPW